MGKNSDELCSTNITPARMSVTLTVALKKLPPTSLQTNTEVYIVLLTSRSYHPVPRLIFTLILFIYFLFVDSYKASKTYVGIRIVQTLALILLTCIDTSLCQLNRLITPNTRDKNVSQ